MVVKVVNIEAYEDEIYSVQHTNLRKNIFSKPSMSSEILILTQENPVLPHAHINCETMIYILQGEGKILYGDKLDKEFLLKEGTLLYISKGEIHRPVCTGEVPLISLVFRNTNNEYEITYKNV